MPYWSLCQESLSAVIPALRGGRGGGGSRRSIVLSCLANPVFWTTWDPVWKRDLREVIRWGCSFMGLHLLRIQLRQSFVGDLLPVPLNYLPYNSQRHWESPFLLHCPSSGLWGDTIENMRSKYWSVKLVWVNQVAALLPWRSSDACASTVEFRVTMLSSACSPSLLCFVQRLIFLTLSSCKRVYFSQSKTRMHACLPLLCPHSA